MKKEPLIYLLILLLFASCQEPDPPQTEPYQFVGSWSELGTSDSELNGPQKIIAHNGFVYINDAGNEKIKKFDKDGVFQGSLNFSSQFYIYGSHLFGIDPLNTTKLLKYDLNFSLVATYTFSQSLTSDGFDDIAGTDTHALITLGGTQAPFLRSLDLGTESYTDFGTVGTGPIEFSWNGIFPVTQFDGKYYVGDPGGKRVQQLDASFTYLDEFTTVGSGRSVANSPASISISGTRIAISAQSNDGDQVDFYNLGGLSFLESQEIGAVMKKSISIEGTRLYILTDFPSTEVMVFEEN